MQNILENESSQYYIKGKELKTELTISVVSFQKEKTNNGSVSTRDDSRVRPDFPHAEIG